MTPPKTTPKKTTEARETRLLVAHGFDLARQLGIHRVLVVAQLLTDRRLVEKHREDESIIWVTHDRADLGEELKSKDHCVEIPRSPAGRMEQITLALVMAVLNGVMSEEESVLCLVGVAGSKRLDNLLIANPKRDFSWFADHSIPQSGATPNSQAFIRLMEIALKFSAEGREGKPIGTIFLLGDAAELGSIVAPLILNPCAGHPRKLRSIYDQDFVESMRELSALDGGFVIDRKGVVEQAGVYLDAPVTKKVKVRKGLGSRHMGAATATAQCKALAIVISESSGAVTVFSDGAEVMSLNRPVSR